MRKNSNGHISAVSTAHRFSPKVLSMFACVTALALTVGLVHADSYQDQINALDAQTSQAQGVLDSLETQASSYQDEINQLQAQINAIQSSINANLAAQTQLQNEIAADQAKIQVNKGYLSDDIKTMYVDGSMSTIEELATSKNLSDYVDQEEYRSVVQDKITQLLNQIQALQVQAQQQKQQVDALLQTEQAQQGQIVADQNAENALLSANQGQQNQYSALINNNNSQVAALRAAQAAANSSVARSLDIHASGGSGGACDIGQGNGGYPTAWCNASQDSLTDPWGFPTRECTSFANWYFVDQEGQSNFSVRGNAGWWWETSNYSATTYPDVKIGAIGVEPSSSLNAPVPSLHGGYYGHVMIVLALPGTTYEGNLPNTAAARGTYVPAGDVLVMSMNEDEEGHFMYNLWPADYLMYINPQ